MNNHIRQLLALVNPFPTVNASPSSIGLILNVVYGFVGAMTFLFVIIGGFKYVVSRGDPQATARAKDTILYAVIGMAIVISAAAITNFVFVKL